jgi:hypothetical protein
MALTKVAKKGLGLLVTLAVVGGGIYAFQHMPQKHNDPVDTGTAAPVQAQQPEPAPQSQPKVQPAPVEQQQPQTDASSNRGMQFLLNQGKK